MKTMNLHTVGKLVERHVVACFWAHQADHNESAAKLLDFITKEFGQDDSGTVQLAVERLSEAVHALASFCVNQLVADMMDWNHNENPFHEIPSMPDNNGPD